MARLSDDDVAPHVSESLERYDEQWTKTAPAAPNDPFVDIPDGTYDAVIEDARLTETASTGRPLVVWTLRIQGPKALNRVLTKNRVITDNTLPYLREDLEKCGLSVERLSELPARLKELVDRPVSIDKRTKDGRANVYFRWKTARATESVGDDDIPF